MDLREAENALMDRNQVGRGGLERVGRVYGGLTPLTAARGMGGGRKLIDEPQPGVCVHRSGSMICLGREERTACILDIKERTAGKYTA